MRQKLAAVVVVAASWVATGARPDQSTTNLDIRFEKLFDLGGDHQTGLLVDVFDATGFSYLNLQPNPGGTWSPAAETSTEGTFSPASTGARGHVGVRTVRFSIRYSFN